MLSAGQHTKRGRASVGVAAPSAALRSAATAGLPPWGRLQGAAHAAARPRPSPPRSPDALEGWTPCSPQQLNPLRPLAQPPSPFPLPIRLTPAAQCTATDLTLGDLRYSPSPSGTAGKAPFDYGSRTNVRRFPFEGCLAVVCQLELGATPVKLWRSVAALTTATVPELPQRRLEPADACGYWQVALCAGCRALERRSRPARPPPPRNHLAFPPRRSPAPPPTPRATRPRAASRCVPAASHAPAHVCFPVAPLPRNKPQSAVSRQAQVHNCRSNPTQPSLDLRNNYQVVIPPIPPPPSFGPGPRGTFEADIASPYLGTTLNGKYAPTATGARGRIRFHRDLPGRDWPADCPLWMGLLPLPARRDHHQERGAGRVRQGIRAGRNSCRRGPHPTGAGRGGAGRGRADWAPGGQLHRQGGHRTPVLGARPSPRAAKPAPQRAGGAVGQV